MDLVDSALFASAMTPETGGPEGATSDGRTPNAGPGQVAGFFGADAL